MRAESAEYAREKGLPISFGNQHFDTKIDAARLRAAMCREIKKRQREIIGAGVMTNTRIMQPAPEVLTLR